MTTLIMAFMLTVSMPQVALAATQASTTPIILTEKKVATTSITVPFYSQFKDITSPTWQKVGCGITSLAMVIDYYKPAVSVNTLLSEGIKAGAYLQNAGWTYAGLISVGKTHGLRGNSYDLAKMTRTAAFAEFKTYLKDGPVIASVHYKFDPKSTIPHLVVINRIEGDMLYYNDPAAKTGEKKIASADFLKAWKKRFIVLRPTETTLNA